MLDASASALIFHPGFQAADVGLGILRLSVGTFFAISGYHKLFDPAVHREMRDTLIADHIPLIRLNEWWVPFVEFTAGIALALGFASVISAALLGIICLVACGVDGLKRIEADYHPGKASDWLDDILYLPETLYAVMLLAVILGGPGAFALDRLFA
jgi:putative oxidoreductase